ncbi:general transcription factor IIE subunit 2-like [Pecten maximus]|uniref:general transcription factor IIE subunit 2-like n=1 Tax=Pecten maximus TaxID=6579 RepID=UPI0014583489|nr:general transcription factor IIE subunit 2-like [Pecten maximus]
MDPALLKERKAFLDRAKAQPTVEKRKKPKIENDDRSAKKSKSSHFSRPKPSESNSVPKNNSFDYKKMQGSSQYKFGILAKIVKYMRDRHQNGERHSLAIDEILDETNQLDVGTKMRHWLITEALLNNPKVKVVDGGQKYLFRPTYEIKDRKGFLNLLKRHDLHGMGGLLKEDIDESFGTANTEKALKALGENVVVVTRPTDKKQVLFYNDKYCRYTVDEEFRKLWRGVSVDGLDEKKIEEYLEKQGITSMQDTGLRKAAPIQKRKKGGGRKTFKKLNEHLEGVLEDYSENPKVS